MINWPIVCQKIFFIINMIYVFKKMNLKKLKKYVRIKYLN